MGWTCLHRSKGQSSLDTIRAEIAFEGAEGKWEIVSDALVNAQYFAVVKRTKPTGETYHFGAVYLIEHHSGYHNFCYKPMSEEMGPYAHDCPAQILDLLDTLAPCTPEYDPAGYARAWRERCRAELAR